MEVAPKHDAFLKGVLDGALVIGARLLEHLVEQVGPSGRLLRVPVLGGSDKIYIGGVALCLRLLLGLILRAALGRRLRDVFLLAVCLKIACENMIFTGGLLKKPHVETLLSLAVFFSSPPV
jgi:hypothetical protein